jgi:hypothetical protein
MVGLVVVVVGLAMCRSWLHARGTVSDLSGQIRCCLVALLFVAVLQRKEPYARRRGVVGFSVNKAAILCGFGAHGWSLGSFCCARQGGEEVEGSLTLFGGGLDLQQGKLDASPGRSITTVSSPPYLMVDWRPLPPRASATASSCRRQKVSNNLQAAKPFRRPSSSCAASSPPLVPSGFVPGDVGVGRAKLRIHRGGEEKGAGLDCVFLFYSSVLSAKCKGLCAFCCYFKVLYVKMYLHRQS